MNFKLFTVAAGLALTATAINANAQKAYKEGFATISTSMMGQPTEAKSYFSTDSSAVAFNAGPASIKVISDAKATYMAILVDVSVASIKKAAILSPAEIEESQAQIPVLTFTPTTETKVISGFNCKKVTAKDAKAGKTYDIWVTNDFTMPMGAMAKIYGGAGGVPIQYTGFQNGKTTDVTVKSITEQKLPAGTFAVPGDFEKITYDDLKSMGGGGN
ncbi:hypothetical protein A0256_15055 [Mucilaginibacter sp. PAMC 26640]|nr:hypothetical protein A0256_15055 [Mucilaginibacter sp. PAMC 26640]